MAALAGSAVVLGLVSSRWGNKSPHPLMLLASILVGLFAAVVCAVPALFDVRGLRYAVVVAGWLCVVAMTNMAVKVCRWGGAVCGGGW